MNPSAGPPALKAWAQGIIPATLPHLLVTDEANKKIFLQHKQRDYFHSHVIK
jgi:hypothetical protein